MKICYVTHDSNLTGASQSLFDILSKIKEYGVEPYIVLGKHGPMEDVLHSLDVPYKVFLYFPEWHDKYNIPKNQIRRLSNTVAIKQLSSFFHKERFDIIHNNSFLSTVGMEAARIANIPYISHNREYPWDWDQNCSFLNEKKRKFLQENSAVAIEISQYVLHKMSARYSNARYIMLHDGIDTKKYYYAHSKIMGSNLIKILIAGTIDAKKGQYEAINAIKELKERGYTNFELNIVGGKRNGSEEKKLIEYITTHQLQSSVHFYPFTDLQDFRKKCDIVLSCSTAEALGRVPIEGQLSGCLTIGSTAGATPEIIKDNNTGLLYKSEDYSDLAKKLLFAANNPILMNEIAKNGQDFALKTYNIESYDQALVDIYRDILR